MSPSRPPSKPGGSGGSGGGGGGGSTVRNIKDVRRVPPNARGDEYEAIRKSGGAFSKNNTQLTDEEKSMVDTFWELIMREGQ
jgi:hypothetical protein